MDEYISKQKAKDLMGCCLASAKAEYKAAKDVFRKARFEDYMLAMRSMIDVVDSVEAADVQPIKHGKWIESKKHILYKKPNGDIDFFAYSEGYCNGVICKKCGEHFCVYCNPLYNEENCERQHYICSECSSTSMKKKRFCPDCGAKMIKDGDAE